MVLTVEQRQQFINRGGELFRTALQAGRQLTETENNEIRDINLKLDQAEYESLHPAPAAPSEAEKRFVSGLEVRSSEPSRILTREMRMADAARGTYPAEFEKASIGRLLRGFLNGDWNGSELEQRVMASSPTTSGGVMVPLPLASRIIDLVRNQSAVVRAGAITVPMDSATLKMARVTSGPTAGWYAEAAAITASDMAFDSVTFTAKKLAALCVVNSELLEDATGIDQVLETALGKALGLELDRVALHGSGSGAEPAGLYGASGVPTVSSVGTATSYAKFITSIFTVLGNNWNPNAAIYSSRTAATLAGLFSGISGDKTPLVPPGEWTALSRFVSNQVSNTLNTGSPATAVGSAAFIGQFDQLAIGVRRTLRIEVANEGSYVISGTPYSGFQKDQLLIRATLRADVQILQPLAFCTALDILA